MSCCYQCSPIVRYNASANTIFKTQSIVAGTAAASLVLPKCVRKNKIFYLQIAQDLPTTSVPAEIQVCCTNYPLINCTGTAVTTSQLTKGMIYLVALTSISATTGSGCSYAVLSCLGTASAGE